MLEAAITLGVLVVLVFLSVRKGGAQPMGGTTADPAFPGLHHPMTDRDRSSDDSPDCGPVADSDSGFDCGPGDSDGGSDD